MNRDSTCIASLRRLLDSSLTAEAISESLLSFPNSHPADEARRDLQQRGFDVAGVQDVDSDRVHRYVRSASLTDGTCEDCSEGVRFEETVAWATPLRDCLDLVVKNGRVFVIGRKGIEGIITRANLQKQPVRLLLFGVISTLEMAMLELIRSQFPDDSWKGLLDDDRVQEARRCVRRRAKRNEEIDLAECLALSDKTAILVQSNATVEWGFESEEEAKTFFNSLRHLRNNLAHSHDTTAGNSWEEIVRILTRAEHVLDRTLSMIETLQANPSS